jgi:hypothetical protein
LIFQKEVEMEDIVEEPLVDIDGCDLKNPLAVVEYVEDLYTYYRKMEVIAHCFNVLVPLGNQ